MARSSFENVGNFLVDRATAVATAASLALTLMLAGACTPLKDKPAQPPAASAEANDKFSQTELEQAAGIFKQLQDFWTEEGADADGVNLCFLDHNPNKSAKFTCKAPEGQDGWLYKCPDEKNPEALSLLHDYDTWSMYCDATNTIVITRGSISAWGDPKWMGTQGADTFVLAHEYGHYIQDAKGQQTTDESSGPERQASCYAGQFILREYPGRMNDIVRALQYHGVKDARHGTPKQQTDALKQGATGDCSLGQFATN